MSVLILECCPAGFLDGLVSIRIADMYNGDGMVMFHLDSPNLISDGLVSPLAVLSHVLVICEEDSLEDVEWLVKKIANLRVFDDEEGVMNRSLMDIGGEILVVSQFTLFASYKKGNRPSWFRAGSHEHSIPLYESFCSKLSEAIGKPVGTGEFGADMKVELLNDGPVTICMDTKNKE